MLFRRRPALVSDLLDAAPTAGLPVALPPGARIVPTTATFTDRTHAEYRADLAMYVLPADSDVPVRTFIMEAQLRPDADKRAGPPRGALVERQHARGCGSASGPKAGPARQLTERFGPLPEAARSRLQGADPEVLACWARRVLSAVSLDDVLAGVR